MINKQNIFVNMSYSDMCSCPDKCDMDGVCIKEYLYEGFCKLYNFYKKPYDVKDINILYRHNHSYVAMILCLLDYQWGHTTVGTRQYRAKLVHKNYVRFSSSDGDKHTHTKLLAVFTVENILEQLGYIDARDGWYIYNSPLHLVSVCNKRYQRTYDFISTIF